MTGAGVGAGAGPRMGASRFAPIMLLPAVPPPLDAAESEGAVQQGAGAGRLPRRRADAGALSAAGSAMMLAPTEDAAASLGAAKGSAAVPAMAWPSREQMMLASAAALFTPRHGGKQMSGNL